MARYDRIARLPCPDRDQCYPGWLALRDLEGREREPEIGRRARLRFLALRPVRRLLARGLNTPSGDSLELQLETVRDEIERLDARDPERPRLMDYLAEVGGRSPTGLVAATLDVGAAAESAGHSYAAEEFYHTGLDLARQQGLTEHEIRALRRLARVQRARGDSDAAIALGREAAELAGQTGDEVQRAMAMDEVARAEVARGDTAAAGRILEAVAATGESNGNDHVRAIAAAGLCWLELGSGEPEAALRHGAVAVELFPMTDPHCNAALLGMGAALRRLGLWDAAQACYGVVETRSTWVEHRAEAATERAAVAAERGDVAGFRRRRARILETVETGDLRLRALLHLGLGRSCLLIGDVDDAREHLRQAIASARDADLDLLLNGSDELLGLLERGESLPHPRPRPASAASREIAARIERTLGSGVGAGA